MRTSAVWSSLKLCPTTLRLFWLRNRDKASRNRVGCVAIARSIGLAAPFPGGRPAPSPGAFEGRRVVFPVPADLRPPRRRESSEPLPVPGRERIELIGSADGEPFHR